MEAYNYPSITDSLSKSTSSLRENMDKIPHLVVGENKKKKLMKKTKTRKDPRDFKPKLYVPPQIDGMDKLRRWLLYGLTALIVGVVVILIIAKLVKVIF